MRRDFSRSRHLPAAPDGTRFLHRPRFLNDAMGTVPLVEFEGDQIER